ncbi:MAG: radical SAM/SPASM domain-containing protein [Desulfobacterales bacterium]|nr:radical SAM/SPASM domain-containing protein [Desulfobacterales bacterium]MDP6806699.1 radical SAM/SPASM domain-containing protein [Desulfobacterales bacterium]
MTDELINHMQDSYGLRSEAKDFPMMVVLSFVYVCNAQCPNCPYSNSDIRDTYKDAMIMLESIFKKIADECGNHKTVLRLSGGGEPMMHPKATELIIYAKTKGCRIGLIANGSKFNHENLTQLIEYDIDAIEFSVDAGDALTYKRVRPGLDWDTLNRNVQYAVQIRNKKNKSTRIIASVINQKGVDAKAADQYWSRIVDKVQIRKFLTWGINADHSADTTPYLSPEQRVPCPWLFERMNIDSRGDVTLCGEDIAFKEKFGNISERTIQEIWNGEEFQRFRGKHLAGEGHLIPICASCPDWKFRSWNYNYWKVLRDSEKNSDNPK